MGSVDFTLMGALLIGSIPGIIVGSLLGSRASDAVLRPILAVTLLVVAVRAAHRPERLARQSIGICDYSVGAINWIFD